MTEEECRRIVVARAGLGDPALARCEKCGAASPLTCHHRRKRSQGGGWTPANIVVLCGSGTTGCHGWVEHHDTEARAAGWALHRGDDPPSVPILHRAVGMRVCLDDAGMLHPV